jgi:protein-L-isoaspartate(D-aspartate) O-methyltransferase
MTSPVREEQRRRLLDTIAAEARDTASWTGRARLSERVMAALARVPRHTFVRERDDAAAYDNRPLGIGHGQTISQPYIVALMTDLLDVMPTNRVLEIGTGSGYQTAVLAELSAHVYTVERIAELGGRAEALLERLGYDNVTVRIGDGFEGWADEAPFDGIIVTAAPCEIPDALVRQLKVGGRLVVPVGRHRQDLQVITRTEEGFHTRSIIPVLFVPMTGEAQGD